jgi:hypothetical protein
MTGRFAKGGGRGDRSGDGIGSKRVPGPQAMARSARHHAFPYPLIDPIRIPRIPNGHTTCKHRKGGPHPHGTLPSCRLHDRHRPRDDFFSLPRNFHRREKKNKYEKRTAPLAVLFLSQGLPRSPATAHLFNPPSIPWLSYQNIAHSI